MSATFDKQYAELSALIVMHKIIMHLIGSGRASNGENERTTGEYANKSHAKRNANGSEKT